MDVYDVVVVGGSANGAQAARYAAKEGLSVLIFEEHKNIGLPEHCSGLFSYSGLEYLDAMPPDDIVFNHDIYGSRLIAPNGKMLTVKKRHRHALVADRGAYDRFLIDLARDSGAQLMQPFRVNDLKRKDGIVKVSASSKSGEKVEVNAKILIDAEGIRGEIARKLGMVGPPKESLVNAAQFFMRDLNNVDKELVEVYQSQEFAPGFFGWVIPMSENSAKIGLGTMKKGASHELERMIKNHPVLHQRTEGSEIYRRIAGRIPPTGPVKTTYSDNILLVGDVAGQTKPTTGGGVILGGIGGKIAGEVAAEAIRAEDYSRKFLKRYQKRWRSEMSRNLWLQRRVRLYMNNLSDKQMNSFFNVLEKKGLLADIEKHGDVDDQGKLAIRLLLTLQLYPFYLRTFPSLMRALFGK